MKDFMLTVFFPVLFTFTVLELLDIEHSLKSIANYSELNYKAIHEAKYERSN